MGAVGCWSWCPCLEHSGVSAPETGIFLIQRWLISYAGVPMGKVEKPWAWQARAMGQVRIWAWGACVWHSYAGDISTVL